jgi:hypothetical protein
MVEIVKRSWDAPRMWAVYFHVSAAPTTVTAIAICATAAP